MSEHLHLAVAIQRSRPPAEWREAIASMPAPAQEECRRYLRGMYYRLQVQAAIASGRPLPAPPADT